MRSMKPLINALSAALCFLFHVDPRIAASASRPAAARLNVVLLVGDDHACYVTGCYGNKLARTPNMDRLAAVGMRFDRAYCNSPMCTPSRQSFLCGRYPRATGVMCLSDVLGADEFTLAENLRRLGYRTGAFGKMHFNSALPHGFETAVTERGAWQAYERQHPPSPVPPGIEVLPQWRPFKNPARVWLNGFYRPYPRHTPDMESSFYADRAIEYIKAHRDEPFFVEVGFREPHSPFWFPVEYRNTYDPPGMPVPQPGPEDAGQIPKIFSDLSRTDKQGITASAYTSTAFLDANVGRVVDAVREAGVADHTLIIYLSDNGYHLGQHGRFEKHSFFEAAVRCPLIMALPGRIRAGTSTRSLVEFVDLFPTILDLAGLPPPEGVALQGRTLVPVIDDPTAEVRDDVLGEYAHSEEGMIRTQRWKLIYRTGKRDRDDGYEEVAPVHARTIRLYDVQNDPEEMTNLASRPEFRETLERLIQRLRDRLVETERAPKALPAFSSPQEAIDWCLTRLPDRKPAPSGDR
jgi:choline-sulfatase